MNRELSLTVGGVYDQVCAWCGRQGWEATLYLVDDPDGAIIPVGGVFGCNSCAGGDLDYDD